jgi:hypothetical protein
VRAQRVEFADIVLVLPDDVEVTGQSVQEELNRPGGRWAIANIPQKTDWLPTSVSEIKEAEVIRSEEAV